MKSNNDYWNTKMFMLRDSPAEFSEPVIIDPVELKVGFI